MKQKILFLFLSCTSLFASIVPDNQTVHRIEETVIIKDTFLVQEAIRVVEDFYKSYAETYLHGTHRNGEVLKEKYLTKKVIEKIERMTYVTGADPIIRAQDFNQIAYETLKVEFLGNNWYMVNYIWNKNDDTSSTNIPLKVTLVDGCYMIDYITPEWNGSLYGDTLFCGDITQHSIVNSSPQFMLESFYAKYTSLYYGMPEGLLPQLETLRAKHLTSHALNQFESAEKEYRLDGVRNYDLIIDNCDFDCLWLPSMTFTLLEKNTFKISYKQGKLEKVIIVGLIFNEGEYKIDNIRASEINSNIR